MNNYGPLLNALVKNYTPLKGDCTSALGKKYQNVIASIQNNTEIIAEINSKLNFVSEEEKCKLLNIKNDLEFCIPNTGGRRRKHRKTKRRKSSKKRRRNTRRR